MLCIVDRLISQTADENIPSSVGMFRCCMLFSCGFFLLHLHCILYLFILYCNLCLFQPLFWIYHQVHQVVIHSRLYSVQLLQYVIIDVSYHNCPRKLSCLHNAARD